MKSQKHKLLDTNSVFYSNIDKLIIVIETTLSKGQIKNAEKYLKYFFEVMVVSYSRISLIKNDTPEFYYNANVTNITETTDARIEITEAKTRFGRRLILQEEPESYFDDKIERLIFKNIKPNNYDVFRFIFSLYQDSIISLLKSDDTYKRALELIKHIPLIASQIISYESSLSLIEKGWFNSTVIDWFMSTYGGSADTPEKIIAIQFEMLRVLQVYIDNDRIDLYRKFLNRLSSSLMIRDKFYYNEAINKYLSNLDKINWKIRYDVLGVEREFNELNSITEFNFNSNLLEERLRDIHVKYGIEITTSTEQYISSKKALMFQQFKSNYIRVLLIKSIVYSFFKGHVNYLNVLLGYHQPEDSDAIWVGENYGKLSRQDIRFMLLNGDSILENDWFFRIEHHGFEVYLNTLIAYFLVRNYLQNNQPITLYTANDSYSTIKQIEYQLEKVKKNYRRNIIEQFFPNVDNDSYEEILSKYIDFASEEANRKEVKELGSSQFDDVKIAEFKKQFVEKFYASSFVRKIFSINGDIHSVGFVNKETERGINTIVPKRIFINQTDIHIDPKDFADSYAQSVAESESINLTIDIESKCTKIKLKPEAFKQFILDNKSNFDIIIQTGDSFIDEFYNDSNFIHSSSIDNSVYGGLNEYIGMFDNHFQVFRVYNYPVNKYVFLKSNNLGRINQYISEPFDNGFYEDIFSFSIINLGQEKEIREKLISDSTDPNMTEDYLKKSVWLRIFESYEYVNVENFSGVSLEIDR